MPRAVLWSASQDMTIRKMRGEGETWAAIGKALGISRNAAIERGRRIGARPGEAPKLQGRPVQHGPNRGPLPACDPATWGLISDAEFPHVS